MSKSLEDQGRCLLQNSVSSKICMLKSQPLVPQKNVILFKSRIVADIIT